ncbi:cyclic phosphodiesterase-like isoform X2 [Quercus lobata]|uniref:cyclic phosphodiesterase-like isoform X2 n=1 Tax=Quercus lobata TaxID=97700 RepID=UPI00124849A6|nr:cyclic phosphodiesterase-like isoform X2 [Quercus lobata]
MDSLGSEFGGPKFEPHITVVGAVRLTPEDAVEKFRSACEGCKAYTATVDRVATGAFFYQCVFLLIHPTTEVVETSANCCGHFGYKNSTLLLQYINSTATVQNSNFCPPKSTYAGRRKKKKKKKQRKRSTKHGRRKTGKPNALIISPISACFSCLS